MAGLSADRPSEVVLAARVARQFYLEGMKRMVEVQRMVGALSGEVDLAKMIDTRFLPDDIKTPK